MKISNNLNFCSYNLNDKGVIEKENQDIGAWGHRRAKYLRYNYPDAYSKLISTGQAYDYYSEVDKNAADEYSKILKQYIKERRIKSIKNKEKKRAEIEKAQNDAEDIVYEKYVFHDWKGDEKA